MAIDKEIVSHLENHIETMISNMGIYIPCIKIAFPYTTNLADACFSVIMGSALTVFINQYAMRMKYPSSDDFTDFGKITEKFREEVNSFFK